MVNVYVVLLGWNVLSVMVVDIIFVFGVISVNGFVVVGNVVFSVDFWGGRILRVDIVIWMSSVVFVDLLLFGDLVNVSGFLGIMGVNGLFFKWYGG